MKIHYNKMTNVELIKLVRLRLENEGFSATITKITIVDKRIDKYFSIRYRVKTKEWADEESGLIFNKFFLDEWKYLDSLEFLI